MEISIRAMIIAMGAAALAAPAFAQVTPDTKEGEVVVVTGTRVAARDIVLTSEVLFDIEVRHKLTDNGSLTLGVENATDVYPRMTPSTTVLKPSTFTTLNNSGASAFSHYSPFSFSGRYVYGRASLDF